MMVEVLKQVYITCTMHMQNAGAMAEACKCEGVSACASDGASSAAGGEAGVLKKLSLASLAKLSRLS